jgi:uncharacterized lipoprotein YddW (UPF0748 family)
MGLNTIILQLRAFGDAFYPSDYYPWSAYLLGYNQAPDYDPLSLFLEATARYDLRVEGWINPFRLTNTQNLESLPADSPLGALYRDGDAMKQDANGIWWLNPADEQAVSLICDGIKELCENYTLSAIQFDDYFYSGVSPQEFGQTEKEAVKALSAFINKVGKIVHRADLIFGISPQGNISADLTPASDTKLYTDLKSWCDKGWIDYLMPQLYYGFSHETAAFETLLQRWKNWLGESEVQLMFGLASYKCGTVDSYAGSGENEWLENDSILADQVACLTQNAAGFSLFRYSSLMLPENETAQAEQEALKQLLH